MEDTASKIIFLRKYLTFEKGTVLEFKQNDFNIIVGENGAGKSTLIDLLKIRRMDWLIKNGYIQKEGIKNQPIVINNSEAFRAVKSQYVDSRKEVYLNKLNQKSHGEAWKHEIERMKKRVKPNSFVIMDEPETALSVESQIELCEWFIRYKKENPYFGCLIATHSLIIQELLADVVINIPSCQHISADEYIKEKREHIDKLKGLQKA